MANHSKIRYSLVFNRKGVLNQYGEALIQIRAYQTHRGNRYFSTGITIRPEHWDKRNRKIKPSHPNHFVYNQRINDQLTRMEAFEIAMINRYGGWPLDRLDEYESQQQQAPQSFTAFFMAEIDNQAYKPDSVKMYRQTLTKLNDYRQPVYFEDLSYKFIQGFDRYLRKLGLDTNTIKKHHDRLRRYVNLAIAEDLMRVDDNPYKKFRAKSKEPERVFLEWPEVAKLEQLEFTPEDIHLARARDVFLFACYTGLRFSDVTRLTPDKVHESDRGLLLSLVAKKTGKRLDLPLRLLFRSAGQNMSKPERLISRYIAKLEPLGKSPETGQLPFFKITNQYLNRSLKKVANLAGIQKRVTSHVARRTFATIMARKVKAPVLQRLLQHSRPDMTNVYVHLSNLVIEEELERIEW